MKNLLPLILLFILQTNCSNNETGKRVETKNSLKTISEPYFNTTKIDSVGKLAAAFCKSNKLNSAYCFLIDVSISSGRKRFFVYNLKTKNIISSGLIAHGCCNTQFLEQASFSNEKGCGCSSLGKYKTGIKYTGRFGIAYKLHGLENSNNNAYERAVVLHSYYSVPDDVTYPKPICNSLGCPMVSKIFFEQLSGEIDASAKPVLLWIFQ